EGHATRSGPTCWASRSKAVYTCATVHAPDPPVGFVEVATLPTESHPTHRSADGHVTVVKPDGATGSATVRLQDCAPPAGLFEVSTLPRSSTATHRPPDGHETSA